jgi:anti-sigma regulatory factor (Ser/Thr protein kinase)
MFLRSEEGNTIVYKISSEMHHIDSVVGHCKEDLSRFNIVSDDSEFKVIVRELLNNAVRHGNHEIIEKTVTCSIEYLGARQFKIAVEDQGSGFNYRNINMDLPENSDLIKRKGYALINAFSKRIEFNEKGNRISVYTEIGYG